MRNRTLPLELAREIDQRCEQFETLWSPTSMQLLEDMLKDVLPEHRELFFETLLELELELFHRNGLVGDLPAYIKRFPEFSLTIRRAYRRQFASWDSFRKQTVELQHASNELLPDFDDFCSVECLGEGGMGVVYLAWDVKLDRQVAIKMIRRGKWLGSQQFDQFLEEARTMGALYHPNIVSVFSVGKHELGPYLVMEYVNGGSLAKYLTGNRLSAKAAVRLLLKVAEGVEFAHDLGIVHRDLSPANILLTESLVPKVADFGLAKWTQEEPLPADHGVVVGTPDYMSPEQAVGSDAIGPRADIYGLGAILYELLTGRPPFRSSSSAITLEQVLSLEPVAPIALQPSLSVDLNTICLKCLRKSPSDRYSSVRALREDLERYLAGRPILARPVGTMTRVYLWVKRNPIVSSLVGCVLCAIFAGLIGTYWQLRRAEFNLSMAIHENELHERNFARAQAAVDYLSQVSSRSFNSIPEARATRQELLQTVEEYYRELLAERPDDLSLTQGLGLTLLRLGQIRADLGLQSDAIRAYREGLALQRGLLEIDATDDLARRHLAGATQNLAGLLRYMGPDAHQEAIDLQRESVAAWQRLTSPATSSAESRLELAKATFSLGVLLRFTGDLQEAKRQSEATIQILDAVDKQDPGRSDALLIRARVLGNLGDHLEDENQLSGSRALHEQAANICRQVLLQQPDHREALSEYASLQNNLAVTCKKLQDFAAAQTAYSTAVTTLERLLADTPDDAMLLEGISRTSYNAGILAFELQDYVQASTAFQRAVDIHTRLHKLSPGNLDIQAKLSARFKRLIASQIARDDFRQALNVIRLRTATWPNNPEQAWLVATEIGDCVRILDREHSESDVKTNTVERQQLIGLAIDNLEQVVQMSPELAMKIPTASEFAYLRETDGFQYLLVAIAEPK